nr:hypothetical protein [Tanacetum cinerariifolium]
MLHVFFVPPYPGGIVKSIDKDVAGYGHALFLHMNGTFEKVDPSEGRIITLVMERLIRRLTIGHTTIRIGSRGGGCTIGKWRIVKRSDSEYGSSYGRVETVGFDLVKCYLYIDFIKVHTAKGVGLRVADSYTGNHREDDFTPLETILRSLGVIGSRSRSSSERRP